MRELLAAALILAGTASASPAAPDQLPRVNDARLQLSLVASDPDIVTPVGLAIDGKGRLFVLESHTHSPPRNYKGPKADRVKVLSSPGSNGRCAVAGVFADGIEDGMNLAFSQAGDLYVVTSVAVLRLRDADGDGVCEVREKVLELLTPQPPYEHAALLGITFSHDGWMYVSRGNVGSLRYTIKGTDGSSVSGYGGGGNVVRCRPDGSRLEEVATGFWNPFGLCFDAFGRLLCVDNDPDARGPNRLVHVVAGGDYGYKSMYGGGGNHPFQSWNGELPGTLPFVAGLGEAPCGVLDANLAALPADYFKSALCTVWGEHVITRVTLDDSGGTMTGRATPLVEGDQDFRPVAIAAAPDGAVYFTDWVSREYPNHGRGRIWRLSAGPGATVQEPRGAFAEPLDDVARRAMAMTANAGRAGQLDRVRWALSERDPFIRVAGEVALALPNLREAAVAALDDRDANVRLGALLALRRARADGGEAIVRRMLGDPDERVRRIALVWAGEAAMEGVRDDLKDALSASGVSVTLFETYLAAVECTSPEFVRALREGREPFANRLPRRLDPAVVDAIVLDASAPPALRAVALTRVEKPGRPEIVWALGKMLEQRDNALRVEVVRTLAAADPLPVDLLRRVAADRDLPADVRAEAVLALSSQPPKQAVEDLLVLLRERVVPVRVEAVRGLQGATWDERVEPALLKSPGDVLRGGDDNEARVRAQVAFAVRRMRIPQGWRTEMETHGRPSSHEKWEAAVAHGGDAASGRRAFFSPRVGCAKCHTVNNRGGRLGPDLGQVGRTKDRSKLVRDILRPSDEFSIDYQAWYVKTNDGNTHLGLQLDLKDRGDIELFTTDGKTVHFAGKDIAAYGALKQSLMPDGLEAGMSVEDFRDLVAYLESLK